MVPSTWTLCHLYEAFKRYGNITFIELFEDISGSLNGRGRMAFSPRPSSAFWEKGFYDVKYDDNTRVKLHLRLEEPKPARTIQSPVDPQKLIPETFSFPAASLEFGVRYSESEMMSMFQTDKNRPIRFEVNFKRRVIDVSFKHFLKTPEDIAYRQLIEEFLEAKPDHSIESWEREESYRFRIQFEHLDYFLEQKTGAENTRAFIIPLVSPPEFYRKLHKTEKSFTDPKERVWSDWDTWFRQVNITYLPKVLEGLPTRLRQPFAAIDIGRWTTYRFVFQLEGAQMVLFNEMLSAIKDYNIDTKLDDITVLPGAPTPIWDLIDPPITSGNFVQEFHKIYLKFPVRYQLEAAISLGVLSEYNLTEEFMNQLGNTPEDRVLEILEAATDKTIDPKQRRIYKPMSIFEYPKKKKSHTLAGKIESYCVVVRTATITPTTIQFNTPTVEYSNRVLRHYAEHADRFLRIRFNDESGSKVRYQKNSCKDDVFTRVHNTLRNGITIGDRHFEFLAFGSSQFREHGAYMFASDEWISAADIRVWMGTFTDIRVVGKYCARLGQCFSATRAIPGVKVRIMKGEDIERNGRNFSDGVGMMSEFVARMIADDLKLPGKEPPSAFQFRLGGCKGVLAVSPKLSGSDIIIRPSQKKFEAKHNGLEVIRPAAFASASLNRQLILVLTALEVPEEIFQDMLTKELETLRAAMFDQKEALRKLTKNVDEHQTSLLMASMIRDGFMEAKEPFFECLLHLWRAYTCKQLKEKTKITVEEGAFLLGVVDETGILKGHFEVDHEQTDEEKLKDLPEVFCQVSDCRNPGQYTVITGICIIARNPSLHPGDIRVVRAVDVPELRHLRDVLVLPQTGDRDLASMCSGGDLDGDDYLISWDQRLIPPVINYEPMDYSAPKPEELDRPVDVSDMISFFVNYMKTDRLGHIANTHTVWAVKLEGGVTHPRCIQLAELHSTAVDYPKTGLEAIMPRSLRPREYPHFMEKKNGEKTYHSNNILGKLYDQVERVDFRPACSANFDQRILGKYPVSERLLRVAKGLKHEYDTAMRRILAQYDIQTEFEIFTSFVLAYKGPRSEYKFHEEIDRLGKVTRDRFRKHISELVGGARKAALRSFVVAMYRVTYDEVKSALEAKNEGGTPVRMPFISFPWIFAEELGKLAKGECGRVEFDPPLFGVDEPQKSAPSTSDRHGESGDDSSGVDSSGVDTSPEEEGVISGTEN
ncbi:RNA dependent RNA polymerase-domain-containing protein [Kalaharituber pfeilii]|nr:RNA dependent RNA polymerase-domain-containing protein [Kalaharituber pfeilii]